MPRFDLNGDPMPDDAPGTPPPTPQQSYAPTAQQPYAQPYQQPGPSPYQQAPPLAPQTGPILPGPTGSTTDPAKVVGAIVGITVLVLIAGVVIAMVHPPAVPAPTSYTKYALDSGLTIDKPIDWEATPIDKTQGSAAVKISGGEVFRNHTAMIEIAEGTPRDFDAHGVVAIADVANALSSDPAGMAAGRYRRLAKNHLWGYKMVHQDYGAPDLKAFKYYQRETFEAAHPAWNLGGPVKGYFVSEANAFDSVAIVCECRESDWPTLQPVFDHVIASLDNPNAIKEDDTPTPASPTVPNIPPGAGGSDSSGDVPTGQF